MTISRGQMNRQLYGLGSLVKKAVKKVTGGIKDIVGSDAGKAALLAAGAFKLGGGSFGQLLKKGPLESGFSLGKIPLVGPIFQGGNKEVPFLQDKGNVALGILGLSTLAGLSAADREEIEEADPTERGEIVKEKLRQSLSRLGYSGQELETKVAEGVSEYFGGAGGYAQGGRIGFAEGPVLPPDSTQPVNPFGPKPGDFGIEEDIPIKIASDDTNERVLEALFEKYLDMGLSPKEAAEKAREEFERMGKRKMEGTRGLAAIGGKMDTASDNAMQAAGIEGLPIRQNPKGVKELDLRDSGGFIPPVGIKEKEDDIPAMLSNNEFVFTADAVRGMGDGDVDLGAQRMYDMMKKLEEGGRV